MILTVQLGRLVTMRKATTAQVRGLFNVGLSILDAGREVGRGFGAGGPDGDATRVEFVLEREWPVFAKHFADRRAPKTVAVELSRLDLERISTALETQRQITADVDTTSAAHEERQLVRLLERFTDALKGAQP